MAKKSSGFVPHGGLFFGNVVNCNADDTSTYCTIVKFFNLFMMFLIVCFVFFFFYSLIKEYVFKGKR